MISRPVQPDAFSDGASTARPASTSLQAWRRALEKEQQAALRAFHAVKAGTNLSLVAPREAASQEPQRTGQTALSSQETRATSSMTACLVIRAPDNVARPAAYPGAPVGPAIDNAAGTGSLPVSWTLTPRVAGPGSDKAAPCQAQPSSQPADPPALAVAMAPWPLRHLHLALVDGGVHGWMRDSSLAEGSRELDASLAALHEALAKAGLRLTGFTLNGRELPLAGT